MVVAHHPTERIFTLIVLVVGRRAIVGGKQWKFTIRVCVPRIQREAVATLGFIVEFLQQVCISEGGIAIALYGVVLIHNIVLIVVDILLLVVVAIAVVVLRGRKYHSCRGVPTPLTIG